MSGLFKPMLAGNVEDVSKLRFPLLASPKLDGIRATIHDGVAMSRSMKPLPNAHIQAWVKANAFWLNGLDGELIVGEPNLPTTYNTTVSAVMCEDRECGFTFWAFDAHDKDGANFTARLGWVHDHLRDAGQNDQVAVVLAHTLLTNQAELDAFELDTLSAGYEGVMLRDLNGRYKNGRSSFKEGLLLKLKRYEDAEAEIVGFEEEMFNANEAFTNELGRTARSSHQENKIGKGRLGSWVVKGLTVYPGVTFNVGTGFSAADRECFWMTREAAIGRIITYKHFPIGAKDAPRHPVFKGFRDLLDMELAA